MRVLQRRPANLVDVWERERYARVLANGDALALLEVQKEGTIDHPDVRFSVWRNRPSTAMAVELEQTLRKVLGLDVDPEPLQRRLDFSGLRSSNGAHELGHPDRLHSDRHRAHR